MLSIIFLLTGGSLVLWGLVNREKITQQGFVQSIKEIPLQVENLVEKTVDSISGISTNFKNVNSFDSIFKYYNDLIGAPPNTLKSMAAQESSLNPNAEAVTTSARGLMQLTRGAAQDAGVDYENLFDPETNIKAGATYLKQQYDRFGNWDRAIRAYFAGAGNEIKNFDDIESNDKFKEESLYYLDRVKQYRSAFSV